MNSITNLFIFLSILLVGSSSRYSRFDPVFLLYCEMFIDCPKYTSRMEILLIKMEELSSLEALTLSSNIIPGIITSVTFKVYSMIPT